MNVDEVLAVAYEDVTYWGYIGVMLGLIQGCIGVILGLY